MRGTGAKTPCKRGHNLFGAMLCLLSLLVCIACYALNFYVGLNLHTAYDMSLLSLLSVLSLSLLSLLLSLSLRFCLLAELWSCIE